MQIRSFLTKNRTSIGIGYLWIFLMVFISCQPIDRNDKVVENSMRVVSQYGNIFRTPPEKIPFWAAVDAPLMGNGDLGVCISGAPEKQVFWLGKNDFWKTHLNIFR